MFDLTAVWMLMIIVMICWGFWQVRKVAETARRAAEQYCQKNALQLLSVAMSSIKCRFENGLKFVATFELNYSPDGLRAKKGEIEIVNGRVNQIYHWD